MSANPPRLRLAKSSSPCVLDEVIGLAGPRGMIVLLEKHVHLQKDNGARWMSIQSAQAQTSTPISIWAKATEQLTGRRHVTHLMLMQKICKKGARGEVGADEDGQVSVTWSRRVHKLLRSHGTWTDSIALHYYMTCPSSNSLAVEARAPRHVIEAINELSRGWLWRVR